MAAGRHSPVVYFSRSVVLVAYWLAAGRSIILQAGHRRRFVW
jgi:hypothetical protein